VLLCVLTPRPIVLLRQNIIAIHTLTASTDPVSPKSPDLEQVGVDKELLFILLPAVIARRRDNVRIRLGPLPPPAPTLMLPSCSPV
jgi:hypothetical protein